MRSAVVVSIMAMAAMALCNPISADLTVTPASIAFQMSGGSVIMNNLTIKWDGNIVTAARLFTNITPNDTGLSVTYDTPTWNNYFFLQPHQHNITMTITADPALEPGNYTITTSVEVMTEAQIIIKNNTVTVTDPWFEQQYNNMTMDRDALEANLSALFSRYAQLTADKANETANYNAELQKNGDLQQWINIFALIIIFLAAAIFGFGVSKLLRQRRTYYDDEEEVMPDGVFAIEEPAEGLNIVERRHRA